MQTILIVDDDDGVTDALADALQLPGRQLILCSDLESAQLAVEREVPACVVTDIRLSGPFRFEGLDFIDHIRRLCADTRIIVMTGVRTEGLDREALQRGAAFVLQKPFGPAELEACLPQPAGTGEPPPMRIPSLESVIDSPLLRPSFQPIVSLSSTADVAFGYESLARFYGAFFSNPAILFEYASRKGRLVDLEMACIRRTLTEAMVLDSVPRIFVNVHPVVITSEVLARTLSLAISGSSIDAERIVLEITEQSSLGDSRIVSASFARLRELGVSFALDDVGMAYSHLAHIELIRPAYLKVSQDFGTDFELDATRTKIVKNVLSLANDFDCELILEGIETAETRTAARDLGIRLGQGYFWGRPSPAASWSVAGGLAATHRVE